MTSVLGRKVGEPRIVRRSELSSAKQSAVHAGEESDAYCCKIWSCLDWPNWLIKCALMLYALGLTEAWTLFGKDSSVVSLSILAVLTRRTPRIQGVHLSATETGKSCSEASSGEGPQAQRSG